MLAGCGGAHTGVDTIGVRITYQHFWLTSFARLIGSGVTFEETTATRVERVAVRPGPVRTIPLERADERT